MGSKKKNLKKKKYIESEGFNFKKRIMNKKYWLAAAIAAGTITASAPYISNNLALNPNQDLPTEQTIIEQTPSEQYERFELSNSQTIEDKIDFESSLADHTTRQSYIDQLVNIVGKPPYVENVLYNSASEENTLAVTNALFNWDGSNMNVKGPYNIEILAHSFDATTLKNEKDFISSLTHEYRHAEIFNDGLKDYPFEINTFKKIDGSFNMDLFLDFLELDAIKMELENKSELSNKYFRSRIDEYMDNYTNIWKNGTNTNPEFVDSIKIAFFNEWMFNLPSLINDGVNKMYIQHPVTNEIFTLPESLNNKYSIPSPDF